MPLRKAHFDSVEAFHHKDGNRAELTELGEPRRIATLARVDWRSEFSTQQHQPSCLRLPQAKTVTEGSSVL